MMFSSLSKSGRLPWWVRVVSVCDAVKGKETITTGMSESDDFGQIGL